MSGRGALEERIRREIAVSGPMPFARFHALALYAPGLGYYDRPGSRVGREGDFVTGPSLSPVLGRTLAGVLPLVAGALGGGHRLRVIDAGAGEGGLLDGVLERALASGAGADAIDAVLVERGEGLRRRARERVARHGVPVRALALPTDLRALEPVPGVVFANELFDALPHRRLARRGRAVLEAYVDASPERLVERWLPAADVASGRFPPGLEVALAVGVEELLGDLAAGIDRGLLVILDYGPEGPILGARGGGGNGLRGFRGGTLVADLVADPGAVDLTAHVDFSRLARAGAALGLEAVLFTAQTYLLLALGFLADPGARAAKRLIHPEDMGGAFRCLALAKGLERNPFAGLEIRDRLGVLRRPATGPRRRR